jgi:NTP pyrophosphatase (non-canonical NTP hydrolase)
VADGETTVAELKALLKRFVSERDWERFHSPKNLVMGLAVETAELMEHFLWLDLEESRAAAEQPGQREAIADELADVACHLLNLSNALTIDLSDAIRAKMIKNERKYPAASYRGKYKL